MRRYKPMPKRESPRFTIAELEAMNKQLLDMNAMLMQMLQSSQPLQPYTLPYPCNPWPPVTHDPSKVTWGEWSLPLGWIGTAPQLN